MVASLLYSSCCVRVTASSRKKSCSGTLRICLVGCRLVLVENRIDIIQSCEFPMRGMGLLYQLTLISLGIDVINVNR